jgi:hypothetical protein
MSKKDWAFWLFVFGCFFLFNGTPDLWDLLHAKAMAWAAAK